MPPCTGPLCAIEVPVKWLNLGYPQPSLGCTLVVDLILGVAASIAVNFYLLKIDENASDLGTERPPSRGNTLFLLVYSCLGHLVNDPH